MMRDHRLAFLEPRIFFRWRSNHVVHFEFSRASIVDQPLPETFLIKPGSAVSFIFFPPPQCCVGNYSFYFIAEKFPREIQQTANSRWHIPVMGRKAWLCIDTSGEKTL